MTDRHSITQHTYKNQEKTIMALNYSPIGWRATEGVLDYRELLSSFQDGLKEEIENSNRTPSRSIRIYNGIFIESDGINHVYQFEVPDQRLIKEENQISIFIEREEGEEEKEIGGSIISFTNGLITLSLQEMIENDENGEISANLTIDNQKNFAQELHIQLEEVKNGRIPLNMSGSMKAFGFIEPSSEKDLGNVDLSTYKFPPNPDQSKAIENCLVQEVTFLWGPPGTGKTHTLSILIDQYIKKGINVLLVSHTNLAVDEILSKFFAFSQCKDKIENGRVIRYGIPSKKDQVLWDNTLNTLIDKNFEKWKQDKFEKCQANIDKLREKWTGEKHRNSDLEDKKDINTNQIQGKIKNLEFYIKSHRNSLNTLENLKEDIERHKQIVEMLNKITSGPPPSNISNTVSINSFLETTTSILHSAKNFGLLANVVPTKEIINQKIEFINSSISLVESRYNKCIEDMNISRSQAKLKNDEDIKSVEYSEKIRNEIKTQQDEIQNLQNTQNLGYEERNKRKIDYISNALVIGCTLTKVYTDPLIYTQRFGAIILDEASMASLPSVFFMSGLVKEHGHIVMSGDPRQLPPIAEGNSQNCKKWLKRDIFDQAGINALTQNEDQSDTRLVMLTEQHRMHPGIAALINDVMYNGKLTTNHETFTRNQVIASKDPYPGHSVILIDISKLNSICEFEKNKIPRSNPSAARVSAHIAEKVYKAGIHNLGIVSPYREQTKRIQMFCKKKGLPKDILIATIHKFQGNEKDCIIFDIMVSPPINHGDYFIRGESPSSEASKLINVAISRAKGKLIIIANVDYCRKRFKEKDAIIKIINRIIESGLVIDTIKDYSE